MICKHNVMLILHLGLEVNIDIKLTAMPKEQHLQNRNSRHISPDHGQLFITFKLY